ncbi:hypothetical protein [Parasitella parasitica]|uniref:non-specific serine/threonine protein kinase n=1 Tax=Parasitella parasitica TaxID=35722 RepID=A0A0B7MS98_9FUNG|nr:hypothetical protein [Parasitella parasitica]
MDSRGIPIVLSAKRSNTTPNRTQQSTTPKRYDRPSSPFFLPSVKNELTLLEAYDTFSESCFLSRYQPTSDDFRCNVRDLYKSNLFTELQSPKPPKRIRSSNLTFETDVDQDQSELPHLDTPKRSRIITASSPIEARTPLGEGDLDLFDDSGPLSPPPAEFGKIQMDEILVKSVQENFVTPGFPHQQQGHSLSTPETPLPLDNTIHEMSIVKNQAILEIPVRRLTRRQAKLAKESENKQEFTIPLPPPKKRGRAAKAKAPEPQVDDTHKAETEIIKQQVQDQISNDIEPEKEQTLVVVEEEQTQIVKEMEEQVDNQEQNAAKERTEELLKNKKKMKEYMKKKSDAEIKTILENFPQLAQHYKLVERAGSGTFSRVYKAKNLLEDQADVNYVAIKLIFDISRPARVANEIRCLAALRSSPGVTPLINAFRHESLTFVVLPYIQFDHFDDFYRDMSADDVRSYISQLLIGLKSAHTKGLMHRDVKPGNFLYNFKTKQGYLADFGLATMSSVKNVNQTSTKSVNNSQYTQKGNQIGYYANDSRSPLQADRSGTKGFRAPEVLLRYRYQTSAIDIWAVGVILLTILTARYPIFEPEDDADGILELAHVFGMKKLKEFTEYYGRTIHSNIPTIPEDPIDLVSFCREINRDRIDKWNQDEYLSAVDLAHHCLQLIHTNRVSASDALNHPFLASSKTCLNSSST